MRERINKFWFSTYHICSTYESYFLFWHLPWYLFVSTVSHWGFQRDSFKVNIWLTIWNNSIVFSSSIVRSLGHQKKKKLHTQILGEKKPFVCMVAFVYFLEHPYNWVHHSWRVTKVLTKCDFTTQILEDDVGLECWMFVFGFWSPFSKTTCWK